MKRPSLNHCYRLVWNEHLASFVAVPEMACGRGKGGKVLLAAALLAPVLALAAPTGGVVTSGAATINQSGTVTNIDQSTQKATINWQGFAVAGNETVNFNQPSTSAITLNRVVGNEKSVIAGALNANGQVFLINSNGMLFAKGSRVNVGGLVASTLNLSDADFNAGNYVFKNSAGAGSIINESSLTATDGGYIALLGNRVSNQGVISATKGTVVLSAGDKVTLNFNGDSLLSVTIDEGTLDALVENQHAIYADGGKVILTAKAADELLGAQVNNRGIVRAQTIDDLTGNIQLYAQGGTTAVDGTLDASAPGKGNGGSIETSGDKVKIADSATVTTLAANGTTGSWLIDPDGFTVAASGGDMTGTSVSKALASNNFTIASTAGSGSDGSITINDAISWSTNTVLTLTASKDININNAITATGAGAGLTMNYGGDYNIRTKASYSGTVLNGNGSPIANADTSGGAYGSINFNACVDAASCANTRLSINNAAYTLIGSVSQLDGLDSHNAATSTGTATTVTGNYAIAHNLDATGTAYANAPITSFKGTLTGLGHTVSNLTISAPTVDYVGLIGNAIDTTTLRDIGLVNANVTGHSMVGSLLGGTSVSAYGLPTNTSIRNAYVTKTSNGTSVVAATGNYGQAGGLVGQANTIKYAFSDADVSGVTVGGLAGIVSYGSDPNQTVFTPSEVSHAHATGKATSTLASGSSGGLIGMAIDTAVDSVYATGPVAGGAGLIGSLLFNNPEKSPYTISVRNSFATGDVTGRGGLIGVLAGGNYTLSSAKTITIDNVYATGNVTFDSAVSETFGGVGGLIGSVNLNSGRTSSTVMPTLAISKAHASGNVTVSGLVTNVGGLIGIIQATRTTNGITTACCGLAASITDSYATGNVDASGTTASIAVGGLIGYGGQVAISGAGASGTVSGGSNTQSNVGGLAGTLTGTTITNSYSDVAISGVTAKLGSVVGEARNNVVITNTFYNSDKYSSSIGSAGTTNVRNNSTALGGVQASDAQYYANGTIDQVLAERAAAAADAAAAKVAADKAARLAFQTRVNEAASTAGNLRRNAQQDSAIPPGQTLASLTSAFQSPGKDVDQNIVFANPRGYSADIRQIEVDGKTFLLDDEGDDKMPAKPAR